MIACQLERDFSIRWAHDESLNTPSLRRYEQMQKEREDEGKFDNQTKLSEEAFRAQEVIELVRQLRTVSILT